MTAQHQHQHQHQQHPRYPRLSVTPPAPTAFSRPYPSYPTPSSSSLSSPFPFSPSTISTPSKRRHSAATAASPSLTSLFLLLFSLRSLYSLLPFLRSSPSSFSLFPFSFLVSFFSFLLTTLSFSFFKPSRPSPDPQTFLSLETLTLAFNSPSHLRPLTAKSLLLFLVFLLRFQALRSCGTAASILVDFSGGLAAKALSDKQRGGGSAAFVRRARLVRGFAALIVAIVLLSYGWDRIGCSPLSSSSRGPRNEDCVRFLPMLLPFLSGFLGFYEQSSTNWGPLRQFGRKRVRWLSLGLTTVMLFFPAIACVLASEGDKGISIGNLGWPLVNTVIFGVVLADNYSDEKSVLSSKDIQREFLATYLCTLVLELFYFPRLSLPGFLFCGLLLWISVNQLGLSPFSYIELGNSGPSESVYAMIMNPIHHILSERKSRKIAFFLLINTTYMVVEFVAGFMSNSLGLISDACHMLFDCAALGIGLYASYISRWPADSRFNYGRGRFEVLSGYVNAVFLVLVGVLIVLESFERILDPQEISTNSLLSVSVGGLLVNMVGLVFFHDEHHHAHHGGGSCSHAHLHSRHHHHLDDHSHDHAAHDHKLTHDYKHTHDSKLNPEHHPYVLDLHNSSDGKSHELQCCNHIGHHDGENGDHRNSIEVQRIVSQSDPDFHGHQCDRQHLVHQDAGHVHENMSIAKCDKSHEISFRSSHDHCHEGHIHNEDLGAKENCCLKDPSSFSDMSNDNHSHSSHIKVSLPGKKQVEEPQKHHHIDHNMEGIFLHVLADTLGSVGVVISTLLIKYKGWLVADPACSIFISVMIISSVIPLLRNSAEILLQRVPRVHEWELKVALENVMRISGVCGIQNIHVWSFTNTEVVGTLLLHVSEGTDTDSARKHASDILHRAGVKDLTLQVECVRD